MLAPLRDWLTDYMEYSKNNECCREYHYWTALTILSATARRNVRLKLPTETTPIYLPLYVMIIGGSGSGKSTAIDYGHNILSKVNGVNILPNKGTMEALVENLAQRREDTQTVESQGIIIASELALFLDRKKHNEGLVPWLLDATGCPSTWFYDTRGGGRLALRNVAISMLAASAPELLYSAIPSEALGNGFMARFICVSQTPVTTFFPFRTGDPISENYALNGLQRRSLMGGEIRLSPEVRDIYVDWYVQYRTKLRYQGKMNQFQAYDYRKSGHLLKVAALIEWARNTEGFKRDKKGKMYMNISISSYKEALRELEAIGKKLGDIYIGIKESVGISVQENELIDVIINKLVQAPSGIIRHDKLLKSLYRKANARTIKTSLQTLLDMKEVKKYIGKSGAVVYELTKYKQLKEQRPDITGE